ncbi:MAG: restriction endonuclease subunit S [Bryobacteraceae bacterium]
MQHNKTLWKVIYLKEELTECCERNKILTKDFVLSVSNTLGFTNSVEYFYKEVYSKDISNYKIVKKGDFAYNPSRINVGSIDFLKNKDIGIVSPLYVTFRTSKNLDNSYLKYYLKSEYGKFYIKNYTSGSVRDSLSFNNLCKIQIPLPSLSEQKRIVEILDRVNSLRQKRKQVIELLDEYLKATFLDVFGDPLKNPKGWEIKKFGELIIHLCDYHSNGSYESLRNNVKLLNSHDYALMIRTTDLENNNFVDNVKYISEEAYNFLDNSKIYGDELIINKIGSAGNIYLMPKLNRPVSLGMNQFALRFNNQVISIFIYFFLKTDFGKKEIKSRIRGAVTKTITKDAVRDIPILLPPLDLQKKFSNIVEKINLIKNQMLASQKELDNLFNNLMQKAFNGEL